MNAVVPGPDRWVAVQVATGGDVQYFERDALTDLEAAPSRGASLRLIYKAAGLTPAVILGLGRMADRFLGRSPSTRIRQTVASSWAADAYQHQLYFIFERGQRLRALAGSTVHQQASEYLALQHARNAAPESRDVLVEFLRDEQRESLDQVWRELRQALDVALEPLVITGLSAAVKTIVTGTVAIEDDPAEARRATLLALGWPTSAEVGRRAGSQSRNAGQWAKDKRDAGQLLGVWAANERTYRHPDFQFDTDGQLRPAVKELLGALAHHPEWTPRADANGWRRAYWLYQPFRSLSRRALAFDAHKQLKGDPDAVAAFLIRALDAETPEDAAPRTPAEVFAEAPEVVIRFAREAADDARKGTETQGSRDAH